MKNLKQNSLLLLLAISLLFTACETQEVVPGDLDVQATQQVSDARATTDKDSYKINLNEFFFIYNRCGDGNLLATEGVWHISYTQVYNQNKKIYRFHSNISEFRITDEATGIEYKGSYVENFNTNSDINDFHPYRVKSSYKIVLTAPGQKNNLILHINYHITIEADGTLRAYVDKYTLDCNK